MRYLVFISFLILLSQAFKAQELSRAEKKKVKMLTREAQAYLDMDDYYMALQYYRQCLAIDPLNERAGTNSAICMQKLAYPVDSTMFLLENLTNSRQPDANFYLALIKHQQRKFDEAILLLQNYRKLKESKRLITDTEVNYRLGLSLNAKEFMAHPGEAHISNMGEAINSKFDDYVPVVNLDESLLYFTSKREGSTGDLLNTDRNFFEDVYCSRKVNGVWQKAENVGPPINSETNDACVALSYDGHSMLVYRTSDDQVSGDLYLSRINDKNQWGELQKLGESINSSFVESSACFSTDSSEIFFSSNRPGGFGGKDIYRIKRLPNQDWSWAYNLGPEVNSAQDEDAPFLHPDGRTLFFSSKGHDCMGNYDVFSSTYDADSNAFSKAKNLGYPINDISNDIFFVLSLDGRTAYYSSARSGNYGGTDIYTIDTRFKPNELKVTRGRVSLDTIPKRSKITLFEKPGNQLQGTYSSNPANGQFILAINPYREYSMFIETEGCEDVRMELKAAVLNKEESELIIQLKKNRAE